MSTGDAATSQPAPKTPAPVAKNALLSTADDNISHLRRILSSQSGIDSSLMLLGYGMAVVHPQLQKLLDLNLRGMAERMAASASKSLQPGETVIASLPTSTASARLTNLIASLKAVQALCSDVRAFMRLWGCLGVWMMARGLYFQPPKDTVLKCVSWGQVVSMGLFLAHENSAYLANKGIIRGWTPEQAGKTLVRSIHCYCGHLALDFVRLYRLKQLKEQRALDEKKDPAQEQKDEAAWWKSLQQDTSYSVLCGHWGGGQYLSDTWVGILMSWVGVLNFRDVWRATA